MRDIAGIKLGVNYIQPLCPFGWFPITGFRDVRDRKGLVKMNRHFVFLCLSLKFRDRLKSLN